MGVAGCYNVQKSIGMAIPDLSSIFSDFVTKLYMGEFCRKSKIIFTAKK